jgi:AraC family transcriptional regulator
MLRERLQATNKATKEKVVIINGSQLSLQPTSRCPWRHVAIEQVVSGPYENPELELSHHLLGLVVSEGEFESEWHVGRQLLRHTFRQGDMGFNPIGELGFARSFAAHETLLVAYKPTLFHQISATVANQDIPNLCPMRDDFLKTCALTLREELVSGFPGGGLYGDSIAVAMANHLIVRYGAKRLMPESIPQKGLSENTAQIVIDYIEANYATDISLDDLAVLVHLSPFYFSRLFKLSTGLSPHQYLIRCRARRAKELILANSQTSLKEVAQAVGFYDAAHLSRHFKRLHGVLPGELLKRPVLDEDSLPEPEPDSE